VVIAIIGILIALLLPAVQQAYHHTWLTKILPFLEQKPLFDQMEPKVRAYGQSFLSVQVETLRCPSDAGFTEPSETHDLAVTNYAGCEGFDWHNGRNYGTNCGITNNNVVCVNFPDVRGHSFFGVFDAKVIRKPNWPSRETIATRFRDVKDGTSNTVMVAETNSYGFQLAAGVSTPRFTCRKGVPRMSSNAVARAAFVGIGYRGNVCCGSTNIPPHYSKPDNSGPAGPSDPWFLRAPFIYTPLYFAWTGPNTDWRGATSLHPNVVNVLQVDGSSRNVRENIDRFIWYKIHCVADGLLVDF